MPYELFCGRSGQPLVLVFLREKFEEKKMHEKFKMRAYAKII